MKYLPLIVLVLLLGANASDDVEDGSDVQAKPKYRDFIPTDEWQAVEDDHALPGGLHIRMDMTTGEKFAKNMPREDAADQAVAIMATPVPEADEARAEPVPEQPLPQESLSEERKRILLGLPQLDPELAPLISKQHSLSAEEVDDLIERIWKRRQQQLIEAFSTVKTEAQVLQSKLTEVANLTMQLSSERSGVVSRLLTVLETIEFEVSRLDNAVDFSKMDGLEAMAVLMQSNHTDVRTMAAWVIGTACKYAHEVQERAIQGAILQKLMFELTEVDVYGSDAHGTNEKYARKLLYAVAGILRGHPRLYEIMRTSSTADNLLQFSAKLRQAVSVARNGGDVELQGAGGVAARLGVRTSALLGDLRLDLIQSASVELAADATQHGSAEGGPNMVVLDTETMHASEPQGEQDGLPDGLSLTGANLGAQVADRFARQVCGEFAAWWLPLCGDTGVAIGQLPDPALYLDQMQGLLVACRDVWTAQETSMIEKGTAACEHANAS